MPGQYSAADLAEQPVVPPPSGKGQFSLNDVATDATPPRKGFLQALGEGPLSVEHLNEKTGLPEGWDKPLSERVADVGRSLWPGKGTEPNSPVLNAVHAIPIVGPGLAAAGKEFEENKPAFAGHVLSNLASGAPGGEATVNWRSPIKLGEKKLPDIPPGATKYVPDLVEKPYNYANAATKIRLQNPVQVRPLIGGGPAPKWAGEWGGDRPVQGAPSAKWAGDVQPVHSPPELSPIQSPLPSGRTAGPAPVMPPAPPVQRPTPAWKGQPDLQPVPPPPGEVQPIPSNLPSGRTPGPIKLTEQSRTPAWQNAQYPTAQAPPAESPAVPAALPSGRKPGPARVLRAEVPPETEAPDFSAKPPAPEPPAPVAVPQPPAAHAPKARASRGGLKPPGRGVSTTITDPATLLPDKIVTDDGVRQWASSNGLSEQDAADFMRANGYAVMGRSELNQMAHGAAADLGMDHGALSDVARMRYGVDSMTKLKPDQMLDLFQNLVGQKGVKGAIRGKGAQAQPPPMARGGIVRPHLKLRKGVRPQQAPPTIPQASSKNPLTIPAGLDPVPDPDGPVMMAKGGVIANEERVRGSIDLPLAPEGMKQADDLGKRFAEKGGIDHIISGNLTRTRQTTEALLRHNPKAKVSVTGALQPWHLGGLEGQPRKQATPIINEYVHKNPNAPIPGKAPDSTAPGESFKGAKNRVLPVIQQAMRQYLQNPNQTIVLVMHRSGISVAHGWAALGFPADLSVDPGHVTQEREHEPVYSLRPGKGGRFELKPYTNWMSSEGRKRPGVFLVAHPQTAWNRSE